VWKLVYEQKVFHSQWKRLKNQWREFLSAAFVLALFLLFGAYYVLRISWPDISMEAYAGTIRLTILTIWMFFFFWFTRIETPPNSNELPDQNSNDQRLANKLLQWWSVRENRANFITIYLFVLMLAVPGTFLEKIFLWIADVLVLAIFPYRRWIVGITLRGNYKSALHLNRITSWTPGCGGSLEGWILIQAGRYGDALALFKPFAFGPEGQPRTERFEFLNYAFCLLSLDKCVEAQKLFEMAIHVPQLTRYCHLGIADSLLAQK
jgi:hypothetical protein